MHWVSCGTFIFVAASEIYFPDQGVNVGPLSWEHGVSHRATKEVPIVSLNQDSPYKALSTVPDT